MKPIHRLTRQLILFLLSFLHFFIGLYQYKDHLALVIIGFILVLLNVGYLLHNFSMNLKFLFAYRIKKPFLKVPSNIALILIGVIGHAILIYLFFLMIFSFIVQTLSFFQ